MCHILPASRNAFARAQLRFRLKFCNAKFIIVTVRAIVRLEALPLKAKMISAVHKLHMLHH